MQTWLRALLAATTIGAGTGAVLSACSNGESSVGDATGDAGKSEGGGLVDSGTDPTTDGGNTQGVDGSFDICVKTAGYEIGCGRVADLTCGDAGFAAWCALNDVAINSQQFDRAELACLTQANCDAKKRHDCDYRAYNNATLDQAQTDLLLAYCNTCEPADVSGCTVRQAFYNPDAGPDSVSDTFIAVTELSDALVGQIKQKCTGVALDAGADASTDAGITACAKAFSNCSGGIFVDALPNCPK